MGDIRSFAVGQLSGRAENNLDFIEEKWISRKLIEMERIEMEGGRGNRELVYWMLVYYEVVVEKN